jgi:hypothetical protein
VPTDIHFAGDTARLTVDEDPSQVAAAFGSAQGLPVRLSTQGDREVYINPGTVAFWSASDSGLQPDPGAGPPQSSNRRQTVTDIWGSPLRKKPRG